MQLIAIVIYAGILCLLAVPAIKKLENPSVKPRQYLMSFLVGATLCTLCIMIPELLFDRFILKDPQNLWQAVFIAFFRAALIEEIVKLLFSRRAINRNKPIAKAEYMLLAAAVGAGYGFTEKLAIGGGVILIVNAVVPLHAVFQLIMGGYLYEAEKAGRAGDTGRKRKLSALAFVVPFFIHGLWDSLLDSLEYVTSDGAELTTGDYLGTLGFIVLVVLGILFVIRSFRRVKQIAASEKEENNNADYNA